MDVNKQLFDLLRESMNLIAELSLASAGLDASEENIAKVIRIAKNGSVVQRSRDLIAAYEHEFVLPDTFNITFSGSLHGENLDALLLDAEHKQAIAAAEQAQQAEPVAHYYHCIDDDQSERLIRCINAFGRIASGITETSSDKLIASKNQIKPRKMTIKDASEIASIFGQILSRLHQELTAAQPPAVATVQPGAPLELGSHMRVEGTPSGALKVTCAREHAPAVAVPDGWQLVPKKPTRYMTDTMRTFINRGWSDSENGRRPMSALYNEILEASPMPAAAQKGGAE